MRSRRLRISVVAVIVVAALAACNKKEDGRAQRSSATGDNASGRPPTAPLGPVVGELAGMRLAVYYTDPPRTSPRAELDRLLAGGPALKVVTDLSNKPPLPFVVYAEPTIAEYAPPDAKSLSLFTRGLSDAEAAALPRSTSVVAIGFFTKASDALPSCAALTPSRPRSPRRRAGWSGPTMFGSPSVRRRGTSAATRSTAIRPTSSRSSPFTPTRPPRTPACVWLRSVSSR